MILVKRHISSYCRPDEVVDGFSISSPDFGGSGIYPDISQLSDKIGCIQMYISIVYIDTYAIQPLMLLSTVVQEISKFGTSIYINLRKELIRDGKI